MPHFAPVSVPPLRLEVDALGLVNDVLSVFVQRDFVSLRKSSLSQINIFFVLLLFLILQVLINVPLLQELLYLVLRNVKEGFGHINHVLSAVDFIDILIKVLLHFANIFPLFVKIQ